MDRYFVCRLGEHRAAKDPQPKVKLENMPVPLTAEMVDNYMGPISRAAKTGDLRGISDVA